MRTFVIGDIHGTYKALKQCFERSGFNYAEDRLISLGDICDGFTQVGETIDELLKVRHYEQVLGNHDQWALHWALTGRKSWLWLYLNLGCKTVEAYKGGPMPEAHIDFLKAARPWIKRGDRIFVHGGFDPKIPIEEQQKQTCIWDMALLFTALKNRRNPDHRLGFYQDIYVGHFPTILLGGGTLPMRACNLWNLDTGAGIGGKLTIMDLETNQYWQSDSTKQLYKR
jgi:serine/threonine protein phosphatase 1